MYKKCVNNGTRVVHINLMYISISYTENVIKLVFCLKKFKNFYKIVEQIQSVWCAFKMLHHIQVMNFLHIAYLSDYNF
jgi:hypothetical protein